MVRDFLRPAMGMMMKDARVQAAVLFVSAVILVAGGYVLNPFWSASRLTEAFRSADVSEIEKRVDFARVEASLRRQLAQGLPNAASGRLDAAIESSLRTERFAVFIRNGRLLDPGEEHPSRVLLFKPRERRFSGPTGFTVAYRSITLGFEFSGLQWRLVDVQLGAGAKEDLASRFGGERLPEA